MITILDVPRRLLPKAIVVAILFVVGCKTTDDGSEEPTVVRPESVPKLGDVFDDADRSAVDEQANRPIVASELRNANARILELPHRKSGATAIGGPSAEYSFAAARTKTIEEPDKLIPVQLAADALEIELVIEQFKEILQFQYFMDPAVSGTVTVTLDTEMTQKEAWELFEYLLWTAGAYASEQNGFLEIRPFAQMPRDRRLMTGHEPLPNVTVEMIRLYHLAPGDVISQLQPFMTEGATATAIAHLNSILMVEAPPNMQKLRALIKELDVLGESTWPVISIQTNTDVLTIQEEINRILPVYGYGATVEAPDGKSTKLVALERHNILVASAPVPEILADVEKWVKALDVDEASEEESIYFYPVQYNTAEDLAEAVSVFFTDAQTTISSTEGGSSGGSSLSGNGTSNSRTSSSNNRTSASNSRSGTRTNTTTAGSRTNSRSNDDTMRQTVFDIPVTLHADGPHNRIIVRTLPRAYAMLEALLKRMDTPPLQVLIQTSIAEITLDDNLAYGFQYKFDEALARNPNIAGAINELDADGIAQGFGLAIGNDSSRVMASIRAVAGKGNTRIVSEPNIIAISDQEATINIGDSVPTVTEFTGSIESDNTGTGSSRNSVQYRDTGTILTVTPHITAKKLVTLDIRQEVSQVSASATAGISSPTISTRELETSLVIEDGTTVVLGGMISTKKDDTKRGVPILMNLPGVGSLFRTTEQSIDRTELLVLITVKVIDVKTDFKQFLKRYDAAVHAINEEHDEKQKRK